MGFQGPNFKELSTSKKERYLSEPPRRLSRGKKIPGYRKTKVGMIYEKWVQLKDYYNMDYRYYMITYDITYHGYPRIIT
jgi:hypothetical protein